MKNFNKYIFDNQDTYVNLTTKKSLPKNSSIEEFRKNYFLPGQEKESLETALFDVEKKHFEIKLIPTWECNLRCNHCFVIHELLKKDPNEIDINKLLSFIESYSKKYPEVKSCSFQFIGGEPALKANFNTKLIKKIKKICKKLNLLCFFGGTTNGYELNKDIIKFYKLLDSFTISLDGNRETHNQQRKSFDKKNPFDQTIENISKLISLGMRDKIKVQASIGDNGFEKSKIFDFYKILLTIGVRYEKIILGTVVPTENNPKINEKFLQACSNQIYTRVCCKYRFMRDFVIDSRNNIYCDYFNANEKALLGSLSDSIDEIAKNHKKTILESMEALSDEKCQKCPVIGLCWGWCCNIKNPSKYCNQSGLFQLVNEQSSYGNLINFLENPKKFKKNV